MSFRAVGLWILTIASAIGGLGVLFAVRTIDAYDSLSYRRHSQLIRKIIPWRFGIVGAFTPVLACVLCGSPRQSPILGLGLFAVALLAAEVYSVCFHRESYVAAFEPHWIAIDARPLGARPARPQDRRLHYLIRTQVIFLLPLIAAGIVVTLNHSWTAWIVFFCFVAKYVPPAWVDYEAYFHWDMHCNILRMNRGVRFEMLWRQICEYGLGVAVGSMPRLYSTEHLIIHHPSNAGPKDIHSPLPYRRSSPAEFLFYMWKTIYILATGAGVVFHKRCSSKQRSLLAISITLFYLVAGALILLGSPLGWWILLVIVYRGANTAKAQYIWHGLHNGSGSSSPLATTILWLPPKLPLPSDDGETRHPEDGFEDLTPQFGSDWAFFDNYHLVHHLHPKAHFSEYPLLLQKALPRIEEFGSPVLALSEYSSFFSDLMLSRFDKVAASFIGNSKVTSTDVAAGLEPWPDTRSAIAIVSESVTGRRMDSALSRAWIFL